MNQIWTRMLRSIYRKEPISSFMFTVGAVDAVIGGGNAHWTLMALGLGTVGVAIALRREMMQRQVNALNRRAIHYLPDRSSRPSLPLLDLSQKHPPG